VLAAACAWSLALQAGQDWRATALASFDDAWQTISDTFYDPAFGGLDWPGVRASLRPKVESSASQEAARGVIREMLAELHRSHFYLLSSSSSTAADALPGDAVVSIDVRVALPRPGVVITRVTAGSPADRAGLRPGQIILTVDAETARGWIETASGADVGARNLEVWKRAYRALHGQPGTTAQVGIQGVEQPPRTVSVAREPEAGQVVKLGNLPPMHVRVDVREVSTPGARRVGVIGFNLWLPVVGPQVDAAVDRFRQHDGLVIDLRGNPGGLAEMMRGIAGHLVSEPLSIGRMDTRQGQLEFRANPRLSTADGRRVAPFAGPVAILVDELTASASECFAGGLQSLGRARVFGRTSMGQALPAVTKALANGDVLMYAIGDFVTSTGVRLEGRGVVPDEAQALSFEVLAAGRDAPLDAALRWVDAWKR
jgi:carboxyl-terminal processing protease